MRGHDDSGGRDRHRRHRPGRVHGPAVVARQLPPADRPVRPPSRDGADGELWRAEVERALDALPAEQREAFVLKHVEELDYDAMAEITGVGISALKMRVKRARAKLRAILEGEGPDGE